MEKRIFKTDFRTLRMAYCELKTFIEDKTWDKVLSLNTTIDGDLGCSGDDNWELLEEFVEKYDLSTEGFDYSKHFLSEGELFGSFSVLKGVLGIFVFIFFGFLDTLFRMKLVESFKEMMANPPIRETADLSFGDMLTWYLTKEYNLRKDICFVL